MDKKEQTKLRVQRYRDKQKSVTSVTQSPENVTQYPAIVYALTDPVKREKLEKIHQSLKDFNVFKEVRYGVYGPTFDAIGEMLEITG